MYYIVDNNFGSYIWSIIIIESCYFRDGKNIFIFILYMLPKFYIVKDEKDLVSGKIIPRKVLNYMPFGFGNPAMSPVMLPKPIKTATDLTVSPGISPVMFGAPTLSPMLPTKIKYAPSLTISESSPFLSVGPGALSATSPFGSVEYRRTPLIPSSPCGMPCSKGEPLVLGPPIIKTSNLISQNIPGIVKIMAGNNIYSINIPPTYIRNIANEINKYAAIVDSAGPLAQFRLITPNIDWSANISSKKIFDFVDSINRRYPGLTYKLGDRDIVYNDLYNHLRTVFGYGYII